MVTVHLRIILFEWNPQHIFWVGKAVLNLDSCKPRTSWGLNCCKILSFKIHCLFFCRKLSLIFPSTSLFATEFSNVHVDTLHAQVTSWLLWFSVKTWPFFWEDYLQCTCTKHWGYHLPVHCWKNMCMVLQGLYLNTTLL